MNFLNKYKKAHLLVASCFVLSFAFSNMVIAAPTVDIDDANKENHQSACEQKDGRTDSKGNCSEEGSDLSSIFRTVANMLLFLVGAVAVIMLIIGGFRYVASNGDPNIAKGARDTILYSIIGIVVAFLAYAGVNFVVTALSGGTTGT